jgi:MFS family permease
MDAVPSPGLMSSSPDNENHRSPDNPQAYEQPDAARPASAAPTEPMLEHESPAALSAQRVHDPYAALRLPNFRFYMFGWLASFIGQQMLATAIDWEVYQRAAQSGRIDPRLAVGLVGGVLALPVLFLSLPAGQLADRFNRRKIMMVSQLLSAIMAGGMAWWSYSSGPLGVMYGLLFGYAISTAMGWPARAALLPSIVPEEVFSNAATWVSSMFQVAAMAGPALGGLVLVKAAWWAYAIDSVCALSFVVFLMLLHERPSARPRQPASLQSLIAGVKFVWRVKLILATITMDLFAVLLGGATALLPAYVQILGVGKVGFGWLRAAPAVGALLMAMILAHRPPMKHSGRNLLWAVAGFGAATIVFGVSTSFVLSFVMLFLTGAFDNVSVVVRHTLVQMLTPESMRGRVSAVNNIFIGASNELGAMESGVAARLMGTVRSVVFGGIGTLVVVVSVNFLWPQVRRFGSLADARPVESDEPGGPALKVAGPN